MDKKLNLPDILKKHKLWLEEKKGGERADLSDADFHMWGKNNNLIAPGNKIARDALKGCEK